MSHLNPRATEAWLRMMLGVVGLDAMPPWAALDYVMEGDLEKAEAIRQLFEAAAQWLHDCRPAGDARQVEIAEEAVRAIRRNKLGRAWVMYAKLGGRAFDEVVSCDFAWGEWLAKAAVAMHLCCQLDPPPPFIPEPPYA